MERYKRTDRLNHQFKEEISLMIQRELKDPRLGFATITRVKVSEDLSHARIWISVLGDAQQKKDTMKAMHSSAGFIRRQLGQRLTLRLIPELHFVLDENAEHALRINRLLNEINQNKPAASDDSAADTDE